MFYEDAAMDTSSLFARIRSKYREMTNVERIIADYFLNTSLPEELTPSQVVSALYVSKASLSRFAQKLGFDGFRQFLYQYKTEEENRRQSDALYESDRQVWEDYTFLLKESRSNINNRSLEQAVHLIRNSKHILIYGDGISGYAAKEFMIRFKRLGFLVEAYTDDFMMQTNSAMVQSATLVIGISLSGNTKNTILGLKKARENGARTLLITSHYDRKQDFDVVLYAASLPEMNTGMLISPQVPILFIIDLLFSRIIHTDLGYTANYLDTLHALEHSQKDKKP